MRCQNQKTEINPTAALCQTLVFIGLVMAFFWGYLLPEFMDMRDFTPLERHLHQGFAGSLTIVVIVTMLITSLSNPGIVPREAGE